MAASSGAAFGVASGASANGILFGKVWQSLQTSFGRACAVWQLVQLMSPRCEWCGSISVPVFLMSLQDPWQVWHCALSARSSSGTDAAVTAFVPWHEAQPPIFE